ncbi:MAG: DUF1003 domain-containing protein [Gammaproteobacteria bacterium]|nr:DUF1003 domain-containing protein [Gammaproteobacteria bacterium]
MIKYIDNLARALLGMEFKELSKEEKKVIESIANEESIVENVNDTYQEELSFGEDLADKVSRFVGSWSFILFFSAIMVCWVIYNSFLVLDPLKPFDPYPYILLNLGLSTLAAIQAPVIMMSQNRQSEKDKLKVDAGYEVSLKTDLEIMMLNQKIDELSEFIKNNVGKINQ